VPLSYVKNTREAGNAGLLILVAGSVPQIQRSTASFIIQALDGRADGAQPFSGFLQSTPSFFFLIPFFFSFQKAQKIQRIIDCLAFFGMQSGYGAEPFNPPNDCHSGVFYAP
jgi:hypothetical protein